MHVLTLDEPTTGLSSYEADRLISSLASLLLELEQEIVVVMTLHQPTIAILSCLERSKPTA